MFISFIITIQLPSIKMHLLQYIGKKDTCFFKYKAIGSEKMLCVEFCIAVFTEMFLSLYMTSERLLKTITILLWLNSFSEKSWLFF